MAEDGQDSVSKLVMSALGEPSEETKISYLKQILPHALEGNCVAQLCLEHYFEACHARNERIPLDEFMDKVNETGKKGDFSCGTKGTDEDTLANKIAALIFGDGPAYLAHALGYPDNKESPKNVQESRQGVKDCFESVVEAACEAEGGCTAFCCVEFFFKQLRLIEKRKEEARAAASQTPEK